MGHLPLHVAHLQVLLPHTSPFIHHASTQNRLVRRRRSDDLQWSPSPFWRLSFKSLASRMMCWYLILLQILLLLLSGDENWLCPMHHHSWHQIAHQCVSLRRKRRYSWWLMLMIVIDDVQARYQRRERSGIRQRLQSKDWRMVLAIDRVREQSQVEIGGASDKCLVNNCHLSPTYRLALRWCPVGRAA